MTFWRALTIIVGLGLICEAEVSAQEARCDAVLAVSTIRDNSRKNISLATLDLVNKENFTEFKSKFGENVSVPIEGIPIDASVSYEQFEQARKTYREEHKFDFQLSEIRDLSTSFLTDSQVNAWVNCIALGQTEILILRTKLVTDSDIVVHALWKVGATTRPGKLQGSPIVIGGSAVSELPREFPASWVPLHFKRERGKAFSLDLRLSNGNAAHIDLPRFSATVNAPLTCLQATEEGCASCRMQIHADLALVANQSVKLLSCDGMIPNANIVASVNLAYLVADATSARTVVQWTISGGNRSQDSSQENNDDLGPVRVKAQSALLRGIKSSPIGRAALDFKLTGCSWVDGSGTRPVNNCSIIGQKGSFVKFDVE